MTRGTSPNNDKQFFQDLDSFIKQVQHNESQYLIQYDQQLPNIIESLFSENGYFWTSPKLVKQLLRVESPFITLLFIQRQFASKYNYPMSQVCKNLLKLHRDNTNIELPIFLTENWSDIDYRREFIMVGCKHYFFLKFIQFPIDFNLVSFDTDAMSSSITQQRRRLAYNSAPFNYGLLHKIGEKVGMSASSHHSPQPSNLEPIHLYTDLFMSYLNFFLPQPYLRSPNVPHNPFGKSFVDIICECWLYPSLNAYPIANRVTILPLLLQLLRRVILRQAIQQQKFKSNVDTRHFDRMSQRTMTTTNATTTTIFGYNNVPRKSCISYELRALLPALYIFLAQCVRNWPLDFIHHFPYVIELIVTVLAPWSVLSQEETGMHSQNSGNRRDSSLMSQALSFMFGKNNAVAESLPASTSMMIEAPGSDQNGVKLEMEAMNMLDLSIWTQYIVEMLPFYTTLTTPLIAVSQNCDYTQSHIPAVLTKFFHIYNCKGVKSLVLKTEQLVIQTINSYAPNIEQMWILEAIQRILLFDSVVRYPEMCSPFITANNQAIAEMIGTIMRQIGSAKQLILPMSSFPSQTKNGTQSGINPITEDETKDSNEPLTEADRMERAQSDSQILVLDMLIATLETLFDVKFDVSLSNQSKKPQQTPFIKTKRGSIIKFSGAGIHNRVKAWQTISENEDTSGIDPWRLPCGEWEFALFLPILLWIDNSILKPLFIRATRNPNYKCNGKIRFLADKRVFGWVIIAMLTFLFVPSIFWYIVVPAFILAQLLNVFVLLSDWAQAYWRNWVARQPNYATYYRR